jgi:hypothetical protein
MKMNVTGTSYNVTDLSDGTWYWLVNATDRAGNTAAGSFPQSFSVDTVLPPPPLLRLMSPNGISVDYSKVTFNWTASVTPWGISTYEIEIDTSASFDSPNRVYYWTNSNVTSYTPDKLFSNGQWYWRIRAEDKAGNWGAWSSAVSFVVNVSPGVSPIMLLLIGGGSGGIAILAVLGFVVYRRAKIPFVVKKIDQSIKLIGKGEMPPAVPMSTRTEIIQGIFREKLAAISKEQVEEREAKKSEAKPKKLKDVSAKKPVEAKPKAPEVKPTKMMAVEKGEAGEADVDMIVKELQKLEGKKGEETSEESDFTKQEKEKEKKKKES